MADQAKVSPKILACPFYVYDAQFEGKVKLPPEPTFSKEEDAVGYAFLGRVIGKLTRFAWIRTILDPAPGHYSYMMGWHNLGSIEALSGAFSSCGFEVLRPSDVMGEEDEKE